MRYFFVRVIVGIGETDLRYPTDNKQLTSNLQKQKKEYDIIKKIVGENKCN